MSDDLEAQARAMGWKPQEEFKGPAEKWVDAGEYIRRGEEVLPIVRNENRKLHDQVTALNGQIAQLTAALNESKTSMSAFAEFQAEMLETKLKEQRTALMAQIREARDAGDDERLADLEESLDENRDAAKTLKKRQEPAGKKVEAPPGPSALTPEQQAEYDAWAAKHPWINGTSAEDLAKQGAAMRFGTDAARQGLKFKSFYDYVDQKMAEAFPAPRGTSKTEDGRPNGGGGGGGAGGGRSGFNALPAEAKAQAEAQIKQFVGANKMFKTADEWRTYYAKQYFAQEA